MFLSVCLFAFEPYSKRVMNAILGLTLMVFFIYSNQHTLFNWLPLLREFFLNFGYQKVPPKAFHSGSVSTAQQRPVMGKEEKIGVFNVGLTENTEYQGLILKGIFG